MKLVHWLLLTVLLLVLGDVVTLSTIYAYRSLALPLCKASGDMKREVHEVYPLLEK